jgi:Putative adhesin
MSSPAQSGLQPPVQMPPPYRHRRSFAGPVVLIILGIVFLFGNLHILSWGRLGVLFAHYWPVLLILWGIIKLIEHQQAQRDGLPTRGIGGGGVFLIICIVVCGLVATQATRFNWGEIRDNLQIDDSDFDNMFGQTYNYDDHVEQDIPATVSTLRVNDEHGAVRISAADNNKITVVVRKRVGAESQSDGDKYNAATKPALANSGNVITLDARTQAAGDHPVESDLDISIPRKMQVQIISRRGDVSVIGRDGEIEVNNQHGDDSIEDVTGNVKLNLEKSSAKVEQITGDVHIDGHLNEVSVTDVKGSVQLDGEFGESVKLARISKNVGFKSSRTDLEFSSIAGELDLDSDDLHAEQLVGPVHLATRSKEINLEDVSGDVRVQDANGGVEVSMRSLGNVQIDDRNGDIHLSVPEKAGFHIDARTHDGEIESDFPEIKIDNNEHESTASGTVGNGASHIVIDNEHNSIEIRRNSARASAAPAAPAAPATPAIPKPGRNLPAPKSKVEPTEN